MKQLVWSLLAVALLLQSCSKDEIEKAQKPTGKYDYGYLVLNQGGFTKSNASVSFVSQDFSKIENDIFSAVNPAKKLGDVAQSMAFSGVKAFVVVNNSNKIEVVNRYTFESMTTITAGLNNPRYAAVVDGKIYVTNWGDSSNESDDFVSYYSVATGDLLGSFSVPLLPEEIITYQRKLYITHSAGFGNMKSVSVVDTSTPFHAIKSIEVGDAPKSISINGGLIYVLCKGRTEYDTDWNVVSQTAGKLVVINPLSDTVSKTFNFSDVVQPSNGIAVANFYYYNVGKNVFKMNLSDTTLPSTPIISGAAHGISTLYGFLATNNHVIITDAKDFNSDGEVFVFGTNGSLVKKFSAGIIPSAVYWNE